MPSGDKRVKRPFFKTAAEFDKWLRKNHDKEKELWIGFWKKATGKPCMTWQESVDVCLCWGWIDGLRRGIDDESYEQRYTPRRKDSMWSAINLKRVEELTVEGRMQPSGLAIHQVRNPKKAQGYTYEQLTTAEWGASEKRTFRANKKAWAFWETCPPGYRRVHTHWVMSAKKPETRAKRLAKLLSLLEKGRRA